ncbi:MAG: transglutaminase domain-containing protein [Bacteroidota bacterium]
MKLRTTYNAFFLMLLCLGLCTSSFAQDEEEVDLSDLRKHDYSEVDNYVNTLDGAKFLHCADLSRQLTDRFVKKHEKVRAIYVWMANNIKYDCKGYDKGKDLKSKDRKKWKAWLEERRGDVLSRVMRERKGLYQDYADFFKELATLAGVDTRIIEGYGRNDESRIGRRERKYPDHSWLAVKLYDEWYLMDVVYGAGIVRCDDPTIGFQEQFTDAYFLADPIQFMYNHLPEKEDWTLVPEAYYKFNKTEFYQLPHVWEGFYKYGIEDLNERVGVIEMPEDSVLNFVFDTQAEFDSITVVRVRKVDGEPTTEWVGSTTVEKAEDGRYSYAFSPPRRGRRYLLTIAIDGLYAITYKIIIKPSDS